MIERPQFQLPSAVAMLYGLLRPITFPDAMKQAQESAPGANFSGVQVVEDDEAWPMSAIGTPIMMPVTLRGGTYKKYDKEGRVQNVTLADLRLPATTLVEMGSAKTITKTQVSASQASVKEVFAFGDWDIRISGLIIDESNHPHRATTVEAMEQRLLEFDALADSIGVDAPMLKRRSVDRLVIRSISFNPLAGKPRMVGYQMQCDSDTPLELLLR